MMILNHTDVSQNSLARQASSFCVTGVMARE